MNLILYVLIVILIIISFNYYKLKEKFLGVDCEKLDIHVISYKTPGLVIGILSGVHGNEPTGSTMLESLLKKEWELPTHLQKGTYIIIPNANACGKMLNTRFQNKFTNRDLNRNFTENGPLDKKSEQILEAFKNCDVVLDFHDGYSFHKIFPKSVGSTLAGTTDYMSQLADKTVEDINKTISNPLKHFTNLRYTDCSIKNTLSCYMRNRKRHYILTEISCQNNIQPLSLCTSQARFILLHLLSQIYS